MQNIDEIVPLVAYLGAKADNPGLDHYLGAFGKKPELEITEYMASLSYQKHGISLSFISEEWTVGPGETFAKDAFVLRGFFLYSNGWEGFDQYKGPLPGQVAFFEHRAMVRAKLGEPHSIAGGNKFGTVVFPLRDQYRFNSCAMSVSYQDEKAIMLTFTTLQEADRLARK